MPTVPMVQILKIVFIVSEDCPSDPHTNFPHSISFSRLGPVLEDHELVTHVVFDKFRACSVLDTGPEFTNASLRSLR